MNFVLDDGYQCHAVYRPCVLGALTAVRCACESSITTDKGHRSSTGKTTVEFWLQQHVNEGAATVPEDDVSIPSPAEEVIDPSTPLDPEGGPYDPSSVVSSLDEMTMASPMTLVSKRVRIDSSENATLTFNIEQEVCVDAAANSASSSQSAGLLQTSLAALSDEYVALQSDMIWEKLQPRLEELFKGLRGDMPSTLRQVFEIQRSSTSEDVADALMPESKEMLITILKNRIDFDGMVGAMTEVSEVRALLAPHCAALLDTEIDKMVSFSSASLSKPTDANSGSQLAPVSSRGMVQSKRKGRKK